LKLSLYRHSAGRTALPLLALSIAGLAAMPAVAQQPAAKPTAKSSPTANPKGKTAGEFYKNVTTNTLKVLTPSDFLGAMGVMTAALGYDCSNCHPGAGTDSFDWVTDRDPKKVMGRKMVDMVSAINKQYFGGVPNVTCFTCHHGNDLPVTSIQLDRLYGAPLDEKRDILQLGQGEPAATKILDDYISAVGGADKWAAVKNYIASGHSEGYGGLGGNGTFTIYAQAPDHHGMWITFPDHPDRGTSAWTYDGKAGWISQPRSLLGTYELTGNDLAGAKLDSVAGFPTQIKTAFTHWQVAQEDTINNHDVYVLQGIGNSGLIGTFYFDKKSNLLVRYVRQTPTPVGRVSIQQDFDDYHDVNGLKFPFKYSFLWLDGRFSAVISDVKVNGPVDASKFAKP
jgi:hypothetical protein